MSLFQGPPDFPGDPLSPEPASNGPKKYEANSFPVILMTPHALDLVNTLIDRSADFDRTLAESGAKGECSVSQKATLLAYGELTTAKGKLVGYIARLMDRLADPNINRKRSEQVRFE